MGGEGGGTNPEQLFAVGYAACFEGALGVVGRSRASGSGDVSIESEVSLITNENRGFNVAVGLESRFRESPSPSAPLDRGGGPSGLPVLQCNPRQRRGDSQGQRPPGAN